MKKIMDAVALNDFQGWQLASYQLLHLKCPNRDSAVQMEYHRIHCKEAVNGHLLKLHHSSSWFERRHLSKSFRLSSSTLPIPARKHQK